MNRRRMTDSGSHLEQGTWLGTQFWSFREQSNLQLCIQKSFRIWRECVRIQEGTEWEAGCSWPSCQHEEVEKKKHSEDLSWIARDVWGETHRSRVDCRNLETFWKPERENGIERKIYQIWFKRGQNWEFGRVRLVKITVATGISSYNGGQK